MKKLLPLLLALSACTVPLDLGEGERLVPVVGPRNGGFVTDGVLRLAGTGARGELARDPATLTESCLGTPCDHQARSIAIERVDDAVAGIGFACALSGGEVRCWGDDRLGALGRGSRDTNVHREPFVVDALPATTRALVAGRHHVCALLAEGSVYCWGFGGHGELGVDPAALEDCGAASAADVEPFATAEGETLRCASTPRKIDSVAGVGALVAGPFATCMQRADGFLCAGRNVDGSLGIGPAPDAHQPVALATPGLISLAIGLAHGCAVDDAGRVHCFGHHDRGQLGVGASAPSDCGGVPCSPTPVRLLDAPPSRAVIAGDDHTCIVLRDETLRCFGSDEFGQVGDSERGTEDCAGIRCARTPHPPVALGRVARIRAAGTTTLLVDEHGTPMAFGDNRYAQCAAHTLTELDFPLRVYY